MGALTSSSKRDISSSSLDNHFHVYKKPRISNLQEKSFYQTLAVGSSNITVSRVSQYPESSIRKKWKREVHAPVRMFKFLKLRNEVSAESKNGSATTSNFLTRRLDLAKKHAINAFRHVAVDKSVLEIVDDNDNRNNLSKICEREARCDDSGTEKIEVIQDDSDVNVEESLKIVEERSVVTLSEDGCNRADDENIEKYGLSIYDEGVDLYASRVEAYKMLEDTVRRRSGRLEELNFEIELNEKKLSAIRLSWTPKKLAKRTSSEVPTEPFVPLTSDEEEEIQRSFAIKNRKKIIVSHETTNIDISGEALQCLMPKAWLNDEIINVYLALLKEREAREPHKFKNCHYFNTFFFKKLTSEGYNYRAVKRWTTEKKLGYLLHDCEKIFVPVHRQIHWCLAIINKKDQKFQYLDSLGGKDLAVLEILAKYYVDEVKDKCGKAIDVSNWEREFPDGLPEQANGYDCGMFMIKYADFSSRGVGFCFTQDNMPYFRLRTAKEILRLRAD